MKVGEWQFKKYNRNDPWGGTGYHKCPIFFEPDDPITWEWQEFNGTRLLVEKVAGMPVREWRPWGHAGLLRDPECEARWLSWSHEVYGDMTPDEYRQLTEFGFFAPPHDPVLGYGNRIERPRMFDYLRLDECYNEYLLRQHKVVADWTQDNRWGNEVFWNSRIDIHNRCFAVHDPNYVGYDTSVRKDENWVPALVEFQERHHLYDWCPPMPDIKLKLHF